MAAPSYATDLATIILEMSSSTGWTLISSGGGGANNFTAPETDDFIQGNNCISRNPWTSANIRGMVYNVAATIASGDAVYIWAKSDVTQALDTRAAGGLQVVMGDTPTTLDCFYVDGSDTAVEGGWRVYAIDPTATPSTTVGGGSGGTNDEWGFRWSVATSGPNKGYPYKIDAIRHGRDITLTAGDATTPATWTALATHSDNGTRRWGIVQGTDTGAILLGRTYWGSGSAGVYSRDANQALVIADTLGFTPDDFSQIHIQHASTDLVWENITIKALGTANRGDIIIDSATNPSADLLGCNFEDIDATLGGGTNTTFDGSTWRGTNAVNLRGASALDCSWIAPTVSADGHALAWDNTSDPDGIIDGSYFEKHGTVDHHAIEFTTTLTDTNITLRNIDFSGFSGTGNAAALNFLRTSGTTTVNLVGCTGTITAKVTGTHTVNFVVNPVTTTITVKDNDTKANIQSAWVYLEAKDGTGPLPYQDTSTWTRSTTTATVVTPVAHELVTGQKVLIEPNSGSPDASAFGVKTVTVTNTTTFTYTVTDAGATTGVNVDVTAVLISEATTAAGIADDVRSLSGNQPCSGWVRKHTTAPYYQQSSLDATINATTGFSSTVFLISDE